MAIELAIQDHRPPLLELKAATRALAAGPRGLESVIASEAYAVGDLTIRYVLAWGVRGGRTGWKGRWMLGWTPIGENQLFGKLRDLEGL